MNIKSMFVLCAAVTTLTLSITGCHRAPSSDANQSAGNAPSCSSNPYLMKYQCSLSKVQAAAENGSADAQYALGYMYYYGIGTVKDEQTAELWIQRAAAQGQPLAKKAWNLINTGATFTDFHQAASGSESAVNGQSEQTGSTIVQQPSADVHKLNATTPTAPITHYLPAYKSGQSSSNGNTSSVQPPLAKHDAIHDPRLSLNAKPVVATTVTTATESSVTGYTVQLLASNTLSDITGYMAAHQLSNKASYYETTLNGKPWYMLTYGQYGTAAQAENALRHLALDLRNHHPWVKSLATIQKEVRTQQVLA